MSMIARTSKYRGPAAAVNPPPSGPAWRQSLATYTSINVSSNKIIDVDPALDAAINGNSPQTRTNANWTVTNHIGVTELLDDYGGFGFCPETKEFTAINGGHLGYLGNCGFRLTLSDASPAFARVGYPSGSLQFPFPGASTPETFGSNTALDACERMASNHTYNLNVTRSNGDVVTLPSGFRQTPGGGGGAMINGYALLHATSDWDTTVPFPWNNVSNNPSSCGGCRDMVRNYFWSLQDRQLTYWDQTTGVRTTAYFPATGPVGYYAQLIYDTLRNLVWIWLGAAGDGAFTNVRLCYFDPASPASGFTAVTIDTGTQTFGSYCTVYDSIRDRFVQTGSSTTNLNIITIPANINSGTFVTTTQTVTNGIQAAGSNGSRATMAYVYDGVVINKNASTRAQYVPFS